MTPSALWITYLALAAGLHELGHWSMARALGYPAHIRRRHLIFPACHWGSDNVISPPTHRFLISTSGITFNIALAYAAYHLGLGTLCLINLAVAEMNAMPWRSSDGRNAYRALRQMISAKNAADRIAPRKSKRI